MGFWGVLGRVDDMWLEVVDKFAEVDDKSWKVDEMWVEAVDKCGEVDDKLFLAGDLC